MIALVALNVRWRLTNVGDVKCPACTFTCRVWRLLCEPIGRTLWCPYCRAILKDPIPYQPRCASVIKKSA